MSSVRGIGMFLEPEGVDPHGGAASGGGTAQDTRTTGVIDIEVFVG